MTAEDRYIAMGRKSGEMQREKAKLDPDHYHRRQLKGWETRRRNEALYGDAYSGAVTGSQQAAMTIRGRLGEDAWRERIKRLSAAGNAARWGKR